MDAFINYRNKMIGYLDFRIKVTFKDTREYIGVFKAFDKYMNIILVDCEEVRRAHGKDGKTETRSLGLIFLRGEYVISAALVGTHPVEDDPEHDLKRITSRVGCSRDLGRGRGMPILQQSKNGNPPPHMAPQSLLIRPPLLFGSSNGNGVHHIGVPPHWP